MSHRRPGLGKGKTGEKPDALKKRQNSVGHTGYVATQNTLDSQETKGSATLKFHKSFPADLKQTFFILKVDLFTWHDDKEHNIF